MDKSGRKALADNLKAITANSKSRRSWTLARRIDTKNVERAEKDEGEKGVSLQAVDEIAQGLGLASWQLLVPGLDLRDPPRLASEPIPAVGLPDALTVIQRHLIELDEDDALSAGDALRLLALRPASDKWFKNALAALIPTAGEESPPESGEVSAMAHVASHVGAETGTAAPLVPGIPQPRAAESPTEDQCQEVQPESSAPTLVPSQQTTSRRAGKRRA